MTPGLGSNTLFPKNTNTLFSIKYKYALISIQFKYLVWKESNTNAYLTPGLHDTKFVYFHCSAIFFLTHWSLNVNLVANFKYFKENMWMPQWQTKTAIFPKLTHWKCCSLALTCQWCETVSKLSGKEKLSKHYVYLSRGKGCLWFNIDGLVQRDITNQPNS